MPFLPLDESRNVAAAPRTAGVIHGYASRRPPEPLSTRPSASASRVSPRWPSAPMPALYTQSPEIEDDIGEVPSRPVGARLHQISRASLPSSSRQTTSQPKLVTTFLPATA